MWGCQKEVLPKKATGSDNISGKLLKQNIHICTDILSIIFTRSLETGQVPSDWNHANVTPVFKKGDKHHPGNYQPIINLHMRQNTRTRLN